MNRYEELVELALEAREMAYAPYSHFKVGAALLGKNGVIYKGCNVENASYPATNCAERTAFFKAVSEGQTEFVAIAIVGSKNGTNKDEINYCAPCGVCRQVMMEFCNPKTFKVFLAKSEDDYTEYTLEEILPLGFNGKNLE